MKKKFIFITLSFIVFFSAASYSAQMPRFLGSEKKFRSYVYNPNEVYRYVGHYNYQGFIEFDTDENVSTISMGDPSLWLFEHLGNRLFLKPVGEDNSETNMTVITNKKVYHFELMAREADDINDKNLIFVVKFIYPDEKDKNIVQFAKKPVSDAPDLRNLANFNFNYEYTGDPAIAPIKVFDNSEFTYFEFAEKSAELPAIFNVDSNGFESLVNFRVADNYIIVEMVGSQFTLRNGEQIVCVYNMNKYSSGRLRQSTLTPLMQSEAPTNPNPFLPQSNTQSSPMPLKVPNAASPSMPIMPNQDPNIKMPGMSY